jgi:2-polyprenyl-6-methoxyphenol hydroxylase-like FAD-dependent oxidoreductase
MPGGARAVVVGGGIAGLAAAASLLRSGWRVRIVEQAAEVGEVGAGLAVTENGRRALAAVHADDCLTRDGQRVTPGGTRARDGSWLMRLPEDRTGPNPMYGIHRQRLHAALLRAADGAELVMGARLVDVDPGSADRPAVATVRTGRGDDRLPADLLVGADGVRSRVRGVRWPGHAVVGSGYTSWRAVVPGTDRFLDRFVMTWGPHAEFGALPIGQGETYWYGYVKHPAGAEFADESAAVRQRFAGWHDDVRALIGATPPHRLLRHDVWLLDRPLPTHAAGRVVLIGDAAHPMLPTMGQGANSALEDGVALGRLVPAQVSDVPGALAGYDRQRRPRTDELVARSATVARLGAHLGPGWRQRARNRVMRLIPGGPALRAGAGVLDWQVPAQR